MYIQPYKYICFYISMSKQLIALLLVANHVKTKTFQQLKT
jgi:hypothetical protein